MLKLHRVFTAKLSSAFTRSYSSSSFRKHYIEKSGFSTDKLIYSLKDIIVKDHIDEFHVGGEEATDRLANLLDIKPGSKILDLGCGLGGAARFISRQYHCQVLGIDPFDEFIEAARHISSKSDSKLYNFCSKGTKIEGPCVWYEVGDGRNIKGLLDSIDHIKWDIIIFQHVLMHFNSQELKDMIRSLNDHLSPGAKIGVYDLFSGNNYQKEKLHLPVPFASEKDQFYLSDAFDFIRLLEEQGYRAEAWHNVTDDSLNGFKRASNETKVVMKQILGDDAAVKSNNISRNLQEGLLEIYLGSFVRPQLSDVISK